MPVITFPTFPIGVAKARSGGTCRTSVPHAAPLAANISSGEPSTTIISRTIKASLRKYSVSSVVDGRDPLIGRM